MSGRVVTGRQGFTLRGFAALLCVATSVASAQTQLPPPGPEYARGKALYETRCDKCHDRSVHRRESRTAKTYAEVRFQVVRWDRELGAIWRGEEIDAVSRYLNERFYGYPCPTTVCAAQRAVGEGGRARADRG